MDYRAIMRSQSQIGFAAARMRLLKAKAATAR